MSTLLADPRQRRLLAPARVVWTSGGAPAVEGAAALISRGRYQATFQATVCWLRGTEGQPQPAMLLDFGREIHGGVRITVGGFNKALGPVRLRVRFGESASEAMATPDQDHAIHDQEILAPLWGSAEFGNTAFRFVRIDLLENRELPLCGVHAVELMRTEPRIGSFRCSDELINQVYETSVRTVDLCMQEYLFDGAKRDRLVWMGDLHPEVRVVAAVWGQHPIVPASVDLVRDDTPVPNWMNGIPTYSIWWLIIQRDWYRQFGNHEYLMQQRPYATALLQQLLTCVGPQGGEALTGRRFLDWPSEGDEGGKAVGLHAMLAWAMRAGAELCRAMGEPDLAGRCDRAHALLRGASLPASPNKQANAVRVLAGLAPAAEVNRDVLAPQPYRGLSPFGGYYVLQARGLAGDVAGGLDLLRKYWGGMLQLGATSFWEQFDLAWLQNAARIDQLPAAGEVDVHATYGDHCYKGHRHSLCHGWSAGPAAWLVEQVLGILPLEPGCSSIRVSPALGDLQWAEGSLPTPRGPVHVRAERRGQKLVKDVSVPPGVVCKE